jgi:hypothetical protein
MSAPAMPIDPKESRVPPVEIARAAERRRRFELNPNLHTHEE